MDSISFQGDPEKGSKLSMEEKREIVYEVSGWSPEVASEVLQSWSRPDILQILYSETGKEKKYTGVSKLKIIEILLKVVSEKKAQEGKLTTNVETQPSPASGQGNPKRQRKNDHPNKLMASSDSAPVTIADNDISHSTFCKNSACKAKLSQGVAFCKRCSCCICRKFDDNKDPSLWLTCSSDPPFQGNSCGLSCHLECALRHARSGIAKDVRSRGLDGCFYCISCGKVNDLLGCWRKQMVTARDTRRVDILCYRVSLSQKLLRGTKRYQKLYEIVGEAIKKLEADVGSLTGLPVKSSRGIVNRLSSGPEVQRLCAVAVESLDSFQSNSSFDLTYDPPFQDSNMLASLVRFEDVCASSLSVIVCPEVPSADNVVGNEVMGYTLWYRRADSVEYPNVPTCTLCSPGSRFLLSGLTPATCYFLKVISVGRDRELEMCEVPFQTCADRSQSPATNSSNLSNPSSVEDENNIVTASRNENENEKRKGKCKFSKEIINISPDVSQGDEIPVENNTDSLPNSVPINGTNIEDSNALGLSRKECNPSQFPKTELPATPFKREASKEGSRRNVRPKLVKKDMAKSSEREEGDHQDGSSSKKTAEKLEEECAETGNEDFRHYVKVIRQLECDGHIETSFRKKFLTWYSLRATPREVRVVKVFVDTLKEDPGSLAEQLIDTFSDVVSNIRCTVVPTGFCPKLWH